MNIFTSAALRVRVRSRVGLGLTVAGLVLFVLGAAPEWFGLDRSPVIGFLQIAAFTVGLGIICLGGYIALRGLWQGSNRSLAADIGQRLVGTGYAIAVACGMADVFGIGTHRPPLDPQFGWLQALGFMLGQAVCAIGLLLLIPYWSFNRRQP